MTDELALPPRKVIRKQLLEANMRLVVLEREQHEVQSLITKLAAQLKGAQELPVGRTG